jgi:hypothetical protein
LNKELKNIITFGASGRIERKVEGYNTRLAEFKRLNQIMEQKKGELNLKFEKLIQVKANAIKSLKRIEKISKNLQGKDRELVQYISNEQVKIMFDRIEHTISKGELAIHSTKGIVTGVSTALGAGALIGQIGVSSTGIAISTLTGAAAANATLAWFGGGAVAVGGGGIAVGTAVLGGIIAIPALVIAGILSHISANKTIKEIEEKELEIIKVIDHIQSNILKFEILRERTDELIISINKTKDVFEIELKKIYRAIYPWFFISKCFKLIKKYLLRRNYFSKKDLERISYIGGLASDFATLIDTKVFE